MGSAASLKVGRNRVSAAPAATLLKGDHVQIQGQLRTREFDKPGDKNGTGKQPVTEIHVTSIFKLDRSAKQNADQPAVGKWPNFCRNINTWHRVDAKCTILPSPVFAPPLALGKTPDRRAETNECFLSGVLSVTAAPLPQVAGLWRLDGAS